MELSILFDYSVDFHLLRMCLPWDIEVKIKVSNATII